MYFRGVARFAAYAGAQIVAGACKDFSRKGVWFRAVRALCNSYAGAYGLGLAQDPRGDRGHHILRSGTGRGFWGILGACHGIILPYVALRVGQEPLQDLVLRDRDPVLGPEEPGHLEGRPDPEPDVDEVGFPLRTVSVALR